MFSWIIQLKADKGASWYTIAGIVAISLIIWGFVEQIYALSVVVFIFVGVYVMMENNAPETMEISIDDNGISIGRDFYEYQRIEGFGIAYDGSRPILLRVRLKNRGLRILDIDLHESIDASQLRAYLSGFLPEQENSSLSVVEKLVRLMKI